MPGKSSSRGPRAPRHRFNSSLIPSINATSLFLIPPFIYVLDLVIVLGLLVYGIMYTYRSNFISITRCLTNCTLNYSLFQTIPFRSLACIALLVWYLSLHFILNIWPILKSMQTVVEFCRNGCGYCQAINPVVTELATKYADARFLRVDAEALAVNMWTQNFSPKNWKHYKLSELVLAVLSFSQLISSLQGVLEEWDFNGTPSFFFLQDGIIAAKIVGAAEAKLRETADKHLVVPGISRRYNVIRSHN